MSKIPNYLNPPESTEVLTDLALYEWSALGQHLEDVHRWACEGAEMEGGLTERVDYLLECLELLEPLHPAVREWRSVALMIINCIHGGSTPRSVRFPAP